MKTFITTLLVLFLSLPMAHAEDLEVLGTVVYSLDGKGVWCPTQDPAKSYGFFFNEGSVFYYSLNAYEILRYVNWSHVEHIDKIILSTSGGRSNGVLLRETLETVLNGVRTACVLATSAAEIIDELGIIRDQFLLRNKI